MITGQSDGLKTILLEKRLPWGLPMVVGNRFMYFKLNSNWDKTSTVLYVFLSCKKTYGYGPTLSSVGGLKLFYAFGFISQQFILRFKKSSPKLPSELDQMEHWKGSP